ncbi:MAG: phosphoribosyltransferase family protein, partial [Candidatus Hodarchaeales archaeon]
CSGTYGKESWTTADRFFEVLQILHLLGNPERIQEIGHKQFNVTPLPPKTAVSLVFTHMPCGKQDHAVITGESNSARMVLDILSLMVPQTIFLVDPHPPESFSYLKEKIKEGKVKKITLVPYLIDVAKQRFDLEDPLIVTADEHGTERMSLPSSGKRRIDSHTVEITGSSVNPKGRDVLLVDDLLLTGGTLLKSVEWYQSKGARSVTPLVIHSLPLCEKGDECLKMVIDALGERFLTTDTVPSETFLQKHRNQAINCLPPILETLNEEFRNFGENNESI